MLAERLPADAPELNPVKYLGAQRKSQEIANWITMLAWSWAGRLTRPLRQMRRRRCILTTCFT